MWRKFDLDQIETEFEDHIYNPYILVCVPYSQDITIYYMGNGRYGISVERQFGPSQDLRDTYYMWMPDPVSLEDDIIRPNRRIKSSS